MAIPQIPDWRERILFGVGAKPTSENLRFFDAWTQAEGGTASNNPFNTTQPMSGSSFYNNLGGGIGVRNYTTAQQGIDATITTLTNGRYGNIIGALREGDNAMKAAAALAASPWGTGALTQKVLGGATGYTPVADTAPAPGAPSTGLSPAPATSSAAPTLDTGVFGRTLSRLEAGPTGLDRPGLQQMGISRILEQSTISPHAVRMMANLGEASKRIAESRQSADLASFGMDPHNEPVTRTLSTLQTGSTDSNYQTIDLGQDFDGPLHPNSNPIVAMAQQYLGTPYLWGGADPRKGFDCSGFVQYLYAQAGISLGRTTYDQIKQGQPVNDVKTLQAGDVVFFQHGGDVHHEGLYIGGGQFIHAPKTGDVVKISSLSDQYYASSFAGGRRFIAPAGPPT
jgi:cell wall-associated NlpC family hydrolase